MKPPPLTLVEILQDLNTRVMRQERRMQGVLGVVPQMAVLAVQDVSEIPSDAADGAVFVIGPTLKVLQQRDGALVGEDEAGPLTVRAAVDWSR